MIFELTLFVRFLFDFGVIISDPHEAWNLQDTPVTDKELFGTESENDEDEPAVKRLCLANEASSICGTQRMGYRIQSIWEWDPPGYFNVFERVRSSETQQNIR